MPESFRVLIVDDDEAMRKLEATLVRLLGDHKVREAADGEQAMAMLMEADADYDVLFLDRQMPGLDGVDVARAVRAAGHQLPILMVTVETHLGQVSEAIEAGVTDYLVKPFLPDTFTQKVTRLFRRLEIRRLGTAFRVKHAMIAPPASVPVDMQARAAAELLLQRQISGVPVVDAENRPVGIITEYELLRLLFDPQIGEATVGDVMTADVVTVQEETLLTDAARLILEHKLRRLPVIRGSQLVGVIARRDLIRFALENGESLGRLVEIARLEAEEAAAPSVGEPA